MTTARLAAPINITFVVHTLETVGGTERATVLIANGLAALGHRVRIVATWGAGHVFALHPDVQLHALRASQGSFKRSFLPTLWRLRALWRREVPDVVIGVDTSIMLLVLPAVSGLPSVRVGWEHFNFNTTFNRPKGPLNRWRLGRVLAGRFAHAVVVLTRRDAELWRARLPRLRAHLQVIANPLSFSAGARPPSREAGQPKVVLSVGRLTEQKGFDLLLDAWARLEPDFPDWRLHIVGGAGEEESNLRAQATGAGLQRVAFVGQVTNIHDHYVGAALYCLSSRYEGLPMVLLECLTFGLPVVAFDCETGPREVIEHEANGLLVPPNDAAALASALRRVMSDGALRSAMGERARAAAPQFELDEILPQWLRLLEGLRARSARLEGGTSGALN